MGPVVVGGGIICSFLQAVLVVADLQRAQERLCASASGKTSGTIKR